MKASKKNTLEGYLLTAPIMLGSLVFCISPFILVVGYSLGIGGGGASKFAGLRHYRQLLNNEMFRLASRNTACFLVVGIPSVLLISFVIALMLDRYVQKHQLLKSVLLLPYTMPVVGSVLLVELLFGGQGTINAGLSLLGLPMQDWMNSSQAFWVAEILYLWKNTGYSVILLLAGLVAIPDDNYAAAELDGASRWQQLRFVTMPQMWYSVFIAGVFSVINAFKCFREIFLIGGIHPHKSIYMLQHFINNTFQQINYQKLSSASVLLFLSVAVVCGGCYSWVLRKEAFRE